MVTSLDYAKSWFYSYLQPLRKERRIACKKTDIAPEGLFAEEAQTIEPPLTKIIAEIKTLTDNFIADVEAEMAKLRELYPIY
ncbi:MAG: hypothetical protein IK100_09615 [Muribaculaceae bacterium]|nr:hypothetical protein [Muribaculaceae bacterium]